MQAGVKSDVLGHYDEIVSGAMKDRTWDPEELWI
jgi:hypothetical protein